MSRERHPPWRLFVACELSDEVKEALGRVSGDLRRMGADTLRWVRPENIHVTLKFLGDVAPERIDAVKEALAGAVGPFALRVRPAGVGTFGGSSLRVVWVGLEGDVEGLALLAGRVDEALAALGFDRERRPFSPHLTLARPRNHTPREELRRLASLVARYEPPPLPELALTSVSLMRSHLGPGGSRYERLAVFPGEAG